MELLYKQLTKEIIKSRLYVIIMLISTTFTTFMFFFVRFSIDGNIAALHALSSLNENQKLYMNALTSNKILAFNFLCALTGLTAFVFFMFFYRFFKTNRKQIGCLKSLGFKDRTIQIYFIVFTMILSFLGAIIGIFSGYFASSILIHNNQQSYSMVGLVRELNIKSILTGFLFPSVMLCISATLAFCSIRGKESGVLMAGVNNTFKYSKALRFANTVVNFLPVKNKFPIRIALRKPVAAVLIMIATMSSIVMFVLGYSLNRSSETVFKSQTEGHNYLYDTLYEEYFTQENKDADIQMYLSVSGTLSKTDGTVKIKQQIVGLEQGKALLSLENMGSTPMSLPQENNVYISPALQQLYGFKTGDQLVLSINGHEYSVFADIAMNAASNCVYISRTALTKLLDLPEGSYNGVFSMKPTDNGGTVTTHEQKLEKLNRDSVSSRSSAVINQVIGCIVGCILIYLALLLNFQDSTRDMLILHLMGYKKSNIKKMLIDIYRPILWVSFFLTIWPGILLAHSIQKSLAVQTGDYMPFQTNILIIGMVFVLINVIYFLVQITFNYGVKRVINRGNVTEYTNAD